MQKQIVVLVAVILATLCPTAHAQADVSDAGPTRVLIVGDSITHGSDGDYTWRYFAWKGLEGADVDFVGPNHTTNGGDGGYADPDFDQDHAARWGLSMWEMLDRAWFPDSTRVDELTAAYQPDIVVEALGANDFMWFNFDADSMSDQVRQFVSEVRSAAPSADVVIGAVPQDWIAHAAEYNAVIDDLAAELSTPESRVVATPVAEMVEGVDTSDNVHPSTTGQTKIAAAVLAALSDLGLPVLPVIEPTPDPTPDPTPTPNPTPDPTQDPTPDATPDPSPAPPPMPTPPVQPPAPDPTQATPPEGTPPPSVPRPPRRVKARAAGPRTVVKWRKSPGAEKYVVRCGHRSKIVIKPRATMRSTAKSCRVRAVSAGGSSSWVRVRVAGRP